VAYGPGAAAVALASMLLLPGGATSPGTRPSEPRPTAHREVDRHVAPERYRSESGATIRHPTER
jgi:hypothetical protein